MIDIYLPFTLYAFLGANMYEGPHGIFYSIIIFNFKTRLNVKYFKTGREYPTIMCEMVINTNVQGYNKKKAF